MACRLLASPSLVTVHVLTMHRSAGSPDCGILVADAQQTLPHVLRLVLIDFAAERAGLESRSRHLPRPIPVRARSSRVIEPAQRAMRLSRPKAWIWSRFSSACSFVVVRQMAQPRDIHFFRDLETSFQRVPEQLPHHVDDVIVGMIIVIPQDHLVPRLPLAAWLAPRARRRRIVSTSGSSTAVIRSRSLKADALRLLAGRNRCRSRRWRMYRGIGLPRIVRLVTGYYIVAK